MKKIILALLEWVVGLAVMVTLAFMFAWSFISNS
jgi:hypothetical protein